MGEDTKEVVALIVAGMKEQKDHLVRIETKQDALLERFMAHEKSDIEQFTKIKTTVGVVASIFTTLMVGAWELLKFMKGVK